MSNENKQPHIFVDNREPDDLCDTLEVLGAQITVATLPIGDYQVSNRLIIERKTREDFESSILDGRLFSQLNQLVLAFPRVLILVEGPNLDLNRISKPALLGAYSSIISDFGSSVFFTRSLSSTAEMIYALAKHEQFANNRPNYVFAKKKANTLSESQRAIVESLPSVGPTLAISMLKYFCTVENIMTAPESELMEIEKIGEKKAKAIRKVLSTRFFLENEKE